MIGLHDGLASVAPVTAKVPSYVGKLSPISLFHAVWTDGRVPLLAPTPQLVILNGQPCISFRADMSRCSEMQLRAIARICSESGPGPIDYVLQHLAKQAFFALHPRDIAAVEIEIGGAP